TALRDIALGSQRFEGLAHGGAADVEDGAKTPLGRQALGRMQRTIANLRANIRDDAVDQARLAVHAGQSNSLDTPWRPPYYRPVWLTLVRPISSSRAPDHDAMVSLGALLPRAARWIMPDRSPGLDRDRRRLYA